MKMKQQKMQQKLRNLEERKAVTSSVVDEAIRYGMSVDSPAFQSLIEAFNKYEGDLQNAGDLTGQNTYGQTRYWNLSFLVAGSKKNVRLVSHKQSIESKAI